MFSSRQYRTAAARYGKLLERASQPNEVKEYAHLAQRYTALADDVDWLAAHGLTEHDVTETKPPRGHGREAPASLRAAEDQALRRLGAAVIMQWDNLPAKLQRELLEKIGSMDDLP